MSCWHVHCAFFWIATLHLFIGLLALTDSRGGLAVGSATGVDQLLAAKCCSDHVGGQPGSACRVLDVFV